MRIAQQEDEERCRRGHKKKMPKLTTARHFKRTGFAALKVQPAIDIISVEIADALRNRRHGEWGRKKRDRRRR